MSARSGFRSALGPHIERFLSHHRSLGKRYDTEESAPRLFDSFLLGRDVDAPVRIAPELIEAFLRSRPRTPYAATTICSTSCSACSVGSLRRRCSLPRRCGPRGPRGWVDWRCCRP